MCPTDSVLFFASEPISEATTAKPLPASPALAASIDALSDKRLVSSAISPVSYTHLDVYKRQWLCCIQNKRDCF